MGTVSIVFLLALAAMQAAPTSSPATSHGLPMRPAALRPDAAEHAPVSFPLPGTPTELTSNRGILFGAYPTPHAGGETIFRFDPLRGDLVMSTSLHAAPAGRDNLAADGLSVWVAGGSSPRSGSHILYRLDAETLHVEKRLVLPSPAVAVANGGIGPWVASGRILYLLNPFDGSIVSRIRMPGRIQLIASSPDFQRLYVTTDGPVRNDRLPLLKLAVGGAMLARTRVGYADLGGPSGIAPTRHGVWVTTPTGMMASLFLLDGPHLQQSSAYRRGGPNSLVATVSKGILWASDVRGGYYCADPSTGHILGHFGGRHLASYGALVATSSGLYVTADHAVVHLGVTRGCRS